jgi:hypothetical protein
MLQILLYWLDLDSNALLDTKIVLGKDGLLGDNAYRIGRDPSDIVAAIVKTQVGLDLSAERFRLVAKRGDTVLFAASLTAAEIFSVDSVTLDDILEAEDQSWSVLGMVFEGIACHRHE